VGIIASIGIVAAVAAGAVGPTPPPFDLTHLPAVGPNGLLGVRPAALAGGAATWGPLGDPGVLGMAFGGVLEINASAAEGPAPSEVVECVFGITLEATVAKIPRTEQGHERQAYLGFRTNAGVVRTAGPFDWAGRLRKWLPNGVPATHAGREYLVVPMRSDAPEAAAGGFAFYCPDARTVAFAGKEEDIKAVIDRAAAGTSGPAPPAGWAGVARAAVAVAATADKPWLTVDPEVKTTPPLDDARDLARSFDRLTVEVPTPADVRLTFAAKDAASARVAEACLNRLLGGLREMLAEVLPKRADPFAFRVTADGTAVRVETPSVPGIVRLVLRPKDEQ
jgi:hypothetical protein